LTKRQQLSHTAGLIQRRKMKAKILKTLTVNGKELLSGTIVDVSEWRNAKTLEGSRYITFVHEEEIKKETTKPKAQKDEATE
jgi:hypothetical protein